MNIEEQLRTLDEKYPLVPYTHAGRLFSTVRRMKAEKEMGIPIEHRTGFAICGQDRQSGERDDCAAMGELLPATMRRPQAAISGVARAAVSR